jgi:flagellar hook-associated protein 3 FlgL
MRVATISIYNNSKYELGRTFSSYSDAADTVNTGKKIKTPSDDPVGFSQVLDIDSTLSQMNQLHENIDTGLTWLTTTETTLDSIRETILETKVIAIAAVNGSYNSDDFDTAADQVNELLSQLVDFANTNVSGQYIFSGTKTDTKPYELDITALPPATYYGNGTAFSISTGMGSRTEVGYPGDQVFGDIGTGDDIFSLLVEMQTDLTTTGGANLNVIMTELDAHYQNVSKTISNIGAKTTRLETKESVIRDFEVTYAEQKSNLEDADLAEAATDLALRQTAYEAVLSATSKILSMNLVDYM